MAPAVPEGTEDGGVAAPETPDILWESAGLRPGIGEKKWKKKKKTKRERE